MTIRRLVCAALLSSTAVACHGSTSSTDTDPLSFPLAGPNDAPDPSKPGPLPVGVRTIVLDDPSRIDPMTNKPRHLVTEIWYPAEESARGKDGETYDITTLLTPDELQQVQSKGIQVPLLHTSAVRDAAPRKTHGPYPLVVFSHGHGGVRWQSTFYTIPLASHGYIVVSPDHDGDTLGDFLKVQMMTSVLAGVETRPQDVMFLLDYFTRDPDASVTMPTTDALYGLIDTAHIGVTGHSFGAFTSMRVAAEDPKQRVKAIVPQAPTSSAESLIGFGQDYILQTPALIEGSGDDHTLPFMTNSVPAYQHCAQPKGLLDILHGGHFTFSDLCQFDLAKVADAVGFVNVDNVINDGCGPTAPTAAVAEPIMNNFAIGWFNIQLRGSTKTWDYITQARADALTQGVATLTLDRDGTTTGPTFDTPGAGTADAGTAADAGTSDSDAGAPQ